MALTYGAVAAAAALTAVASIIALRPLLARYAMARPTARSSHTEPTPQGGGIAVLLAVGVAVSAGLTIVPASGGLGALALLAAAVLGLGLVGALDDLRPMPVLPRLALQTAAVAVAMHAAGPDVRLLPEAVPFLAERALAVIAGVWFVNLVNFMDGLDLVTVAETVPITAALVLLAIAGLLPSDAGLVAAALLGGMLGFAVFNRPPARLFLGDVGSLPVGLLLAWLLYRLADAGPLAAALLLPFYYCADTTLTLLRRLAAGERVWEAHRSHFYQRATANGFSVREIVGHVFLLNVALAALAASSFLWRTPAAQTALVLIGGAAVATVLRRFATPRAQRATP